MGAAVVVDASQALGPPTLGPSYLTWLVAGGAPLVAQVPAAAIRLCNQNPDQRQHAAAGTGVQIGIGRIFYEAMQSFIAELRPSRWEARDQVQRTENCVTFC